MEFPKTMYTPDGSMELEVNNQREYQSCLNGGWIDCEPAPTVAHECEPTVTPYVKKGSRK